jgi:hypothetical protein
MAEVPSAPGSPAWPAGVPEWLKCPERCRPKRGYKPETWVYRVMRGDESDLLPLFVASDFALPPTGDEDDLIENVLESIHRGSKFRTPFLSATTSEAKAQQLLLQAYTFKHVHNSPDRGAYLRRIDLSKLHPGQVIPFSQFREQKKLCQDRSAEVRFRKYFTGVLGPGDVQPTDAAHRMSEYLLVARAPFRQTSSRSRRSGVSPSRPAERRKPRNCGVPHPPPDRRPSSLGAHRLRGALRPSGALAAAARPRPD